MAELYVRDGTYFSNKAIDSYNKAIRMAISAREPGKSTAACMEKYFPAWKRGHTYVIIRRRTVAITDEYIQSLARTIRIFNDGEWSLKYERGSRKDGVVSVKLNDQDFVLIVSLSISIDRIKSLVYHDIEGFLFDEFICNPAWGEKYLPHEVEKLFEVYNTLRRFYIHKNDPTKPQCPIYFYGNPYSLYNPYFLYFGVKVNDLKPGMIQSGPNWVVQYYKISDKLRALLLATNPLYQFEDDKYARYALEGIAINDEKYKIDPKMPQNYPLSFVVRIENQYIGIYMANDQTSLRNGSTHYCRIINKDSIRREVMCFDFDQLVDGTVMKNRGDEWRFVAFRLAMQKRKVEFDNVMTANLCEEIYYNL